VLLFTEICLEAITEYVARTVLVVTLMIDVTTIVVLTRRDVFRALAADDDDTKMVFDVNVEK
jgi:hypothetical protein